MQARLLLITLVMVTLCAGLGLADACMDTCLQKYQTNGTCAWWCGGDYFYSGVKGICTLSRCCCIEPEILPRLNTDLKYYPEMFIINRSSAVILVVGENASNASLDTAAALAAAIGNGTIIRTDSEIVDPFNMDIISIGSACANRVTAMLMGSPFDCTEGLVQGEGYIRLYNHNDSAQIVVAGYSLEDEARAAYVLANHSAFVLEGRSIIVNQEEPMLEYKEWPYQFGSLNLSLIKRDIVYADFSIGHFQTAYLETADAEIYFSQFALDKEFVGYEVFVGNEPEARVGLINGIAYENVTAQDCDAIWAQQANLNGITVFPENLSQVVCVLTNEGQNVKLHPISKDNLSIQLVWELMANDHTFGCNETDSGIILNRGEAKIAEFEDSCLKNGTTLLLNFSCEYNRGIADTVQCVEACENGECILNPTTTTISNTTTTISKTTTTSITTTTITPIPGQGGCCLNPGSEACVYSTSDVCCPATGSYQQMIGGVGPANYQECIQLWFYASPDQEACALMTENKLPMAKYCMEGCCCELLTDKSVYFHQEKQITCTGYDQYWMPFEYREDCNAEACSEFISFSANLDTLLPITVSAEVCVNTSFEYCINDTDPNQNVIFLTPDLPEGASFDQKSLCFNWTPMLSDVGVHEVHINPVGPIRNILLNLTVDPCNNTCPQLDVVLNATACIGAMDFMGIYMPMPWVQCITAFDEDGDNLTYSFTGLPNSTLVEINGTHCINWTPKPMDNGTYSLLLAVDDGKCTTTQSVVVMCEKCSTHSGSWIWGFVVGVIAAILIAILAFAAPELGIIPFVESLLGLSGGYAVAAAGLITTIGTLVIGIIVDLFV